MVDSYRKQMDEKVLVCCVGMNRWAGARVQWIYGRAS